MYCRRSPLIQGTGRVKFPASSFGNGNGASPATATTRIPSSPKGTFRKSGWMLPLAEFGLVTAELRRKCAIGLAADFFRIPGLDMNHWMWSSQKVFSATAVFQKGFAPQRMSPWFCVPVLRASHAKTLRYRAYSAENSPPQMRMSAETCIHIMSTSTAEIDP